MVLKVFSVYDSKVENYFTPFFMRSKGEALRAWQHTVNDEQSNMCKFPADFTLFELGEFDDSNGSITMYSAKVSLGCALEFKNKAVDQVPLFPVETEKKGN